MNLQENKIYLVFYINDNVKLINNCFKKYQYSVKRYKNLKDKKLTYVKLI